MGKQSKRRQKQVSSMKIGATIEKEEEWVSNDGLRITNFTGPSVKAGDGPGKDRTYEPDEITPWKEFCSNCYSGVAPGFDVDREDYGLKACSNCRAVWYCSKECQAKHWKHQHKAVCKKAATATAGSTASSEERRKKKELSLKWEEEHKEMLDKERQRNRDHMYLNGMSWAFHNNTNMRNDEGELYHSTSPYDPVD